MPVQNYLYELDVTGLLVANKIVGEVHTIQLPSGQMPVFVIPNAAPFFKTGFEIFAGIGAGATPLVEGVDFIFTHRFIEASSKLGKLIYGGVAFLNRNLSGQISLSYQTLGGAFTLDTTNIVVQLTNNLYQVRTVTWDQILGVPELLPPLVHQQDINTLKGFDEFIVAMQEITTAFENLIINPPAQPAADYVRTFRNPTVLLSTQDLNIILDLGVYVCPVAIVASTTRNYPVNSITGYLLIYRDTTAAGGVLIQEYRQIKDAADAGNYGGTGKYQKIWRRYSDSNGAAGTWTAWVRADVEAAIVENSGRLVGEVAMFARKVAPTGWIVIGGQKLGKSGAQVEAPGNFPGLEGKALYTHLWETFTNAEVLIYTSTGVLSTRGASAEADWNAEKYIVLWNDNNKYWKSITGSAVTALSDIDLELQSMQNGADAGRAYLGCIKL